MPDLATRRLPGALYHPETGLYTREALLDALARYVSLADRLKQPVTVMMLECDGYAQEVALHGVAFKEAFWQALAQRVQTRVRGYDLLGHWSEGRLLAVLPSSDLGGSLVLAQDLKEMVGNRPLDVLGQWLPTTLSVAVCGGAPTAERPLLDAMPELLVGAERALDTSVDEGPNRVAVAPL
jgi:diguanylate cyclase (GGDEF)-like protein